MDASVLFCFGLWGRLPPKLFEQSSAAALLLFYVPHDQWALLDADMLALIDGSASLVEPGTCACRIKCVPHGPLTVSVVRPHREVFAPHSPGTFPFTVSEESWPACE